MSWTIHFEHSGLTLLPQFGKEAKTSEIILTIKSKYHNRFKQYHKFILIKILSYNHNQRFKQYIQ